MATNTTGPTIPKDTADQIRQQVSATTTTKGTKPARQGVSTTTVASTVAPTGVTAPGDFNTQTATQGQGAVGASTGTNLVLQENAVIDMTGIPGAGGKNQRLRAGDWKASLDRYTPDQLGALQRMLWEGGFYTNDYYYQNGKRPAYRNKLDEGLPGAYYEFIILASNNPQFKATDIFDVRRQQNANVISSVGSGGASQPSIDVIGTQVAELPAVTDIGALVDKAAKSVLGRVLDDKDRERFVSMVSDLYRQQAMTSADVRVANQKANYPLVEGGVQTAGAGAGSTAEDTRAWDVEQIRTNKVAQQNIATITRIARERGYSDEQIIGILANVAIESGFNHKVKPGDSGKAVGLFQQWPSYGSVADRTDPVKATNMILDEAKRVGMTPDKAPKDAEEFARKFDEKVERSNGKARGKRVATAAALRGNATVKQLLGASTATPPTGTIPAATTTTGIGATGPGMISVVADYPGAISTPSGGKLLVTQSPMGQSGIEEQIRKENPVEAEAVGLRRGFDVFARMMGGRGYGA